MTNDVTESTTCPALALADDRRPLESFCGSIFVADLERNSLSRKFENVQCWLACDGTVVVN